MGQTIKNKKQKGTTLLEALVATAIIAIGFIAIFQMITYSMRSMDTSGERTKINYLADMILEDVMAYKSSEQPRVGRDPERLFDALINNRRGAGNAFWELDGCVAGAGIDHQTNAEDNIINKWSNRFSQRRLRCTPGDPDRKALQTYTVCDNSPAECTNNNDAVFDRLYFGVIEISIGDANKNLYFRIH